MPSTKVRFVVPHGVYETSAGTIEQTFHNDTVTIVDVRIDVKSNSTVKLELTKSANSVNQNVVSSLFKVSLRNRSLQVSLFLVNQATAAFSLIDLRGNVVSSWQSESASSGNTVFNRELDKSLSGGIYILRVDVTSKGSSVKPNQHSQKLTLF